MSAPRPDGRRPLRLVSATFLALAIGEPTLWHELRYDGIAANSVAFAPSLMRIEVERSSSPLILPLGQTVSVSSVRISGRLTGGPLRLNGAPQGSSGADDFALRVGLVVPGGRQLNLIERQFAPDWLLRLSDFAGNGLGLDHVRFLNAVEDAGLVGQARVHQASDLLRENFVWRLDGDGPFSFEHKFETAVPTAAVWIAADGDDTGSSFTLDIERLEIGVE